MPKKSLSELLGGQSKFGMLSVIGEDERPGDKRRYALCRCSCGAEKSILTQSLRLGQTKSCGCYRITVPDEHKRRVADANRKHGMAGTPEYSAWRAMRYRCTDPRCKAYPRYGGRGITVDPKWLDSFEAFFADMGTRPEGHSLERIDNDAGYSPSNCKWATRSEQNKNRRAFTINRKRREPTG